MSVIQRCMLNWFGLVLMLTTSYLVAADPESHKSFVQEKSSKAPVQESGDDKRYRITQLTKNGHRNGQPFWSPDGNRISYVSNRTGAWEIWINDEDGGKPTQITNSPTAIHSWPSWHPNGNEIFFYTGDGTVANAWKLKLATGEQQLILPRKDNLLNFRPLVSPDGKQLLFDRVGPTTQGNHDLFKIDLKDNSLTQLTKNSSYDSDARWTTDGKRIVFHSDRNSEKRYHTQIFTADSNGKAVRKLTTGSAVNKYPCWSPDGKQIAYVSVNNDNHDIWSMNSDGTNKRRLTYSDKFDSEPAWSPDGKKIVFTTGRYGNSRELAIIHLNDD